MDIFDSCLNHEPPTMPNNAKNNTGDFVEPIASLEKSHIEEGYADGYKVGLVAGKQDGYEVGMKHGFEAGKELGFYHLLVKVWIAAICVDTNCFSVRIKKTVQRMKELLDNYPLTDPEDETKDDIVEGLGRSLELFVLL